MPVCVNPFGALYNPASIAQAWRRLESGPAFADRELVEYNGLWHSFLHHGDFSGPDRETVLRHIRAAWDAGAEALHEADYLMLTLGTAWVYEREGCVVANCHKLPAKTFTRRRLTADETVELLAERVAARPALRVILTVSPVIHRGDGLIENQLSKASLIVAAHSLAARFPERVFYFPSYEIVTSELRDYRFYAEDMCHPSPTAVVYVRERFAATLLEPEAVELMTAADELRRAMEHRPLHPDSPEYARFCAKMRQKAEALQERYKNVDFAEELRFFG